MTEPCHQAPGNNASAVRPCGGLLKAALSSFRHGCRRALLGEAPAAPGGGEPMTLEEMAIQHRELDRFGHAGESE
jgi:hypothetical protein